jgi:hypothetical protein
LLSVCLITINYFACFFVRFASLIKAQSLYHEQL